MMPLFGSVARGLNQQHALRGALRGATKAGRGMSATTALRMGTQGAAMSAAIAKKQAAFSMMGSLKSAGAWGVKTWKGMSRNQKLMVGGAGALDAVGMFNSAHNRSSGSMGLTPRSSGGSQMYGGY